MLEIIALIFLTKKIKALAIEKGEKPGKWAAIQVASWFGLEICGALIVIAIAGEEALIGAVVVGICLAVSSYFVIKNHLENKNSVPQELDEFASSNEKNLDHFR